jgi:pyruvyltransferase
MKAFFYFVPYNGNFGDELAPLIIQRLLPKQELIFYKRKVPQDNTKKILTSIGSIIHLIPDGSYVWGTGHNPNKTRIPKDLKIFATRGPISMNYLNSHGYNLDKNKIAFGDPALLVPRLFPEWLEPMDKKHEVTLIPHHNDIPSLDKIIKDMKTCSNINVVYCNSGVSNVINNIRSSQIIISSSLHGIILGEMLNKKTIWLQLDNSKKTETSEKYLDYYLSTGRSNIIPTQTLDEALNIVYDLPIYDDKKLYESFYECVEAI